MARPADEFIAARLIPFTLSMLLLFPPRPNDATTVADACPMNATELAPEGARQREDGYLTAGRPERSYPPSAYRPLPDGRGYALCTCELRPCVRKCCLTNMAYGKTKKCSKFEQPSDPLGNFTIPKFINEFGMVETHETDKFHLVPGKLICSKVKDKYILEPTENNSNNFQVSETGWLLNVMGSAIAPPGQFCLEKFADFDFQILPVVCSLSPKDLNQTENEYDETEINMFYTIGMMLSLPFLFSTFLVYALIRELRNLHGKSLMCHVATLLVAYTSLIVVQFVTSKINKEVCISLAYIIQFSFLASFFWLNVMCFDLWWTFSGCRPLRGNLKEHEAKKFIFYSIYAWGSTTLISLLTFYMELSPNKSATVIRPDFGKNSCWFDSSSALLLYFYGPISILLLSNLLMFIYTAIMIIQKMRDVKELSGSESNRHVDHDKQRFMLYLKLFIVMGVNWSAEIVSWAIGSNGSQFLWYVADIGNSLQGVLIFLIFVCKKRVLRLLNKKLCPRFQLFKISNNISTKTTNSTVSKTSTKHKDSVEMVHNSIQTSTSDLSSNTSINVRHDFKV